MQRRFSSLLKEGGEELGSSIFLKAKEGKKRALLPLYVNVFVCSFSLLPPSHPLLLIQDTRRVKEGECVTFCCYLPKGMCELYRCMIKTRLVVNKVSRW